MATGSVPAFWLVALLLIVVPGADWAFTIGAGVRGEAVPAAVGGLVAGYTLMTAAVAAGVGTLVAGSPGALTVLTVAGGLYLIQHGLTTAIRPAALLPTDTVTPDERPDRGSGARGWAVFGRGVAVSGLNPKGLLIFLALLPQFTSPHAPWPVGAQLAVLGGTFTATCAGFYLLLGSLAGTVLAARPGLARVTGRICGIAMTTLGAALLLDRLLGVGLG
jgi:threonine/homoserine/homoserine lactone efflux protein